MSYYTPEQQKHRNPVDFQQQQFRVPQRIDQMKLADFETTGLYKLATGYLDNFPYPKDPKGLYIYGDGPGHGKSSFVTMLCRELINRGKTRHGCIFVPVPDMIDALVKWATDHTAPPLAETPWFKNLLRCDVVVFDDCGTERLTAYASMRWYQIFNALWGEDRVVMCTSRWKPGDMLKRAAEGVDTETLENIASRMAALVRVVEFSGDDYRLIQK